MAKLGIDTVWDLLTYPPRRYLDRSLVKSIKSLKPGETVTVFGRIADASLVRTRRGFVIFNLLLQDDSGYLRCLWFNQPYLKNRFHRGQMLVVNGLARWDRGLTMINPEYQVLESQEAELIHLGRIVPLYPSTAGLSNRQLRTIIKSALDQYLPQLSDPLPEDIVFRNNLVDFRTAVQDLHFPQETSQILQARRRLAFEELLGLQLLMGLSRSRRRNASSGHILRDRTWRNIFDSILPFSLTSAQARAVDEIERDLESGQPMYRLLQGDVGSGKTVVALSALLKAAASGFQAAVMAPTEILAEQHYLTLKPWLEKSGIACGLLLSRMEGRQRQRVREELRKGTLTIAIGTHALIQEDTEFCNLGLAVIDEQHRFGVKQRAALLAKGTRPHILVMTATPIPRTLAMTLYGDLDISVIDELPPGRLPVTTRWTTEANRTKMLEFVGRQIAQGRQAFFVCPVIEESENQDIKAAVRLYHKLQSLFSPYRVGLIHGRMKLKERHRTMDEFRRAQIRLLVATTVIEVGIDVPNATVMVVEQAERFGLSQLHQLRGRIGRGGHRSYCILMAGENLTPEARARLEAMQESQDGFRIAERDLEIRGPGELWGSRQHGLPELRLANLISDAPLIPPAKSEAARILSRDPELNSDEGQKLRWLIKTRFPAAGELMGVG